MRHYRATNKTTGEVIEYDAVLPQPEHLGADWRLEVVEPASVAPDAPPQVPAARRVTKLQFIERLGNPAFTTILTMAKQDIEVAAFMTKFMATTPDPDGTSVDLTDPRTIEGVTDIGNAMVQLGVVTSTWADEVLNGE